MRYGLIFTGAAVLLAASSAWGLTIQVEDDAYVDMNTPDANYGTGTNNLMVKTQGTNSTDQASDKPRFFVFIQFTLGNTLATDVALSLKTTNNQNGERPALGYVFIKETGFEETTLTYNSSFLGGPGGAATTDGSFAQIANFITNAGWTRLDVASDTAALNKLAPGGTLEKNKIHTTNPVELVDFYNNHLGDTVTFLFESCSPLNGNTPTWFSKEGADLFNKVPAYLTVTEVPEPATALLLAVGGALLLRRRASA